MEVLGKRIWTIRKTTLKVTSKFQRCYAVSWIQGYFNAYLNNIYGGTSSATPAHQGRTHFWTSPNSYQSLKYECTFPHKLPGFNPYCTSFRVDEFTIETPADLGKLNKIIIGHNGDGAGSGWYLQEVNLRILAIHDHKISQKLAFLGY